MEQPSHPFIRPVEPPVDYPIIDAANDDYADLPPGAAIASYYGGAIGLAIMVLTAVFVGFALAMGKL